MFSQGLPQAVYRSREVGFDAAFRAAHGLGGIRHIQSLQYTQHKGFPLTARQGRQCGSQGLHGRALGYLLGRIPACRVSGCLDGVRWIVVRIPLAAEETHDPVADHPATQAVADTALQDAVEQRRPLFLGTLGVALSQLSIASWTASRASSGLRKAIWAMRKARRSTLARNAFRWVAVSRKPPSNQRLTVSSHSPNADPAGPYRQRQRLSCSPVAVDSGRLVLRKLQELQVGGASA